ncbi:MAG: thioesterase [Spirochaetes bacterium]|nr:thioesterase [Spirochaetota bacterium]
MIQEISTHTLISRELCGNPIELSPNRSVVSLITKDYMKVDEKGLVHGGFVFGLADHAAMIAVNHPNVVLAGADVRFHLPIKINEEIVARAEVVEEHNNKRTVRVIVVRDDETVFSGNFFCVILDKHILEK